MASTCCRLCLSNSDDLESIFSVKNGSLLMDLIKIICPIPIETAEDDLPQSICQECVEIVTSAHQIRVMSVQSDFKLRSMRYRDPLVKSEVTESSLIVESPQKFAENCDEFDDDWDNGDFVQHSEYEPVTFDSSVGIKSEEGRVNKRLAKRLKCDRCQFRSSYKNTMAIHTRSHLTDDAGSAETKTPFNCNFCGNVYANRYDQQCHIRFEHRDSAAGSRSLDQRQTSSINETGEWIFPEKKREDWPQIHQELLSKYFEPIDEAGFSHCKLCANIQPAYRRGSSGKVKPGQSKLYNLSRHIRIVHSESFENFKAERQAIDEKRLAQKYRR